MIKKIKKEYIKDFEVKNLIPYERNPRINDKAVDGVIKSIKHNGDIDPIEIDEDNIILTGHTRLKAFNEMKIEIIDVLRVTGLTEEQKKRYRVDHNKTNELADWDLGLLNEDFTVEELKDMDFDMDEDIEEKNLNNTEENIELKDHIIQIECKSDEKDELINYLNIKLQETSLYAKIK